MSDSIEQRFSRLQRALALPQPDGIALSAELQLLRAEVQRMLAAAAHDTGRLEEIARQMGRPADPPLLHAMLIGPSGRGERTYVVSMGGQRHDVSLAPPPGVSVGADALVAGRAVLVNKEQVIVGVVGDERRGEIAEVRDVLYEGPDDPFRLVVRSPGGASMVVDVAEGLARLPVTAVDPLEPTRPRIGDTVLLDTTARLALEKLPVHETGELEVQENPKARYEDVAGLDEQIDRIRDAIELPYLERGRYDTYGLKRPHGILLYGPPGCGKTMIGAAVANGLRQSLEEQLDRCIAAIERYLALPADQLPTERTAVERMLPPDMAVTLDQPREALDRLRRARGEITSYFLNVKGPELLSKWVGEAEQRIRQIFEEARQRASYTRPVVVFFDEIESMFQRRGSGVSSDMEKTMVPQLLTELDGVRELRDVVLIGSSNRHELLDPALLRPGRLDIKIKIDRPDREATRKIFFIHLDPPEKGSRLPLSAAGLGEAGRHAFDAELIAIVKRLRERGTITIDTDTPSQKTVPLADALPDALLPDVAQRVRSDAVKRSGERLPVTLAGISRAIAELLREHLEPGARKSRVLVDLADVETLVHERPMPRVPLEALAAVTPHADRRALLSAIVDVAVDAIFSADGHLQARVLAPCAREHRFQLREFVSGALIASIVTRAKHAALKREVRSQSDELSGGIAVDDLLQAVRDEYSENKDQFIANKPEIGQATCDTCKRRHDSAEEYDISVVLGHVAHNRWTMPRVPPYELARAGTSSTSARR